MRFKLPPETRIILALLPVLNETVHFKSAAICAAAIVLGIFAAVNFIRLTSPFFPKKLLPWSLVLGAAAVFQILRYWVDIPALWLASFLLLFDWNDIGGNHLGPRSLPLIRRLAGFALCLLALGLAQESLVRKLGPGIFQQPAGSLLLLAACAWVLGNIEKSAVPKVSRRRKPR